MVGSHTDITARREAEAVLQDRLAFENIITNISTTFINMAPEETDAAIQRTLQIIGEFAGVARSYVFLYSGDQRMLTNTHEWCAPNIRSHRHRLQAVPVEAWAWTNTRILQGELLHFPDIDTLPEEAEAEREEFREQGIRSMLCVPLLYRGEVIGFLGFDAVRQSMRWTPAAIRLLTIVGEIFVNALEHKRSQVIEQGQRQFLELLATGGTLEETLEALIRIIEEQAPGMLGLVLLLDEDGQRLRHGASVSLPLAYVESVDGLEIGPAVGSCGTAAFTGERVVVENIAEDPRWAGLRELALEYGLHACWSEPVISGDGRVLGTFAMYYRYPRAPTPAELRTIETAAHLVGVAVERKRAEESLRRSEERFRIAAESATDLIYEWDLVTGQMDWFGDIEERLGYDPGELPRTREAWEQIIHPEDRARVQREVSRRREEGTAYYDNYRVLRKDGTVLYWEDRGRALPHPGGEPRRWIGANTDITD